MNNTWKNIFINQLSTGRFWKRLFKDDHDKQKFIVRNDAITICKIAQRNIYEFIIDELDGKIDNDLLKSIRQKTKLIFDEDISGLGL